MSYNSPREVVYRFLSRDIRGAFLLGASAGVEAGAPLEVFIPHDGADAEGFFPAILVRSDVDSGPRILTFRSGEPTEIQVSRAEDAPGTH